MIFASLSFIFLLLPFFLFCDGFARIIKSIPLRNAVLLFVSLLFYTWGEAVSVLLLLGLGIINYAAGAYLPTRKNPFLWLIVFVAVNVAVLIGFKYSTWLLAYILPSFAGKKASIPLGISFFTFHAISYLIDLYRRQIDPAKTALDFLTYFCMFPHLVAGPIVRYAQVQDDLVGRGPDKALWTFGLYRFLVGINKKVLVANSVALMADSAFSLSAGGHLHFFDAWLGIMAYAVQIYFDFSGYSDMAIGLAAMAGFHFEENFRRPYSSASIREFWRRWHISLSSWLRDYLYIPLGGSKRGTLATYRNLLTVFFFCGLWHGADLTFILWGLWHGLFLVMERLLPSLPLFSFPPPLHTPRVYGRLLETMRGFLSRSYTLLVVLVGWVFFRAENIHAAGMYLEDMFTFSLSPVVLTYHTMAFAALVAGAVVCLLHDRFFPGPTCKNPAAFSTGAYCVQAILALASLALLLTGARNPFIYFDF